MQNTNLKLANMESKDMASAAWLKDNFEAQEANAPKGVLPYKQNAYSEFEKVGFPSTKDEAWKYTNLQPVVKNTFTAAKNISAVTKADIEEHLLFDKRQVAVFVNGYFSEALSKECSNAEDSSVQVSSLKSLLDSAEADSVINKFSKNEENEPLVSFNSAFFNDGFYVKVPAGHKADVPLQVVCLTSSAKENEVSHSKFLIELEEGASLEVIEHHFSVGKTSYMTSIVGDALIAKNANLQHVKIQQDSSDSCLLSTLKVQQEESSNFNSTIFSFGGGIVRNEVYPTLQGEGIDSTINGLTVLSEKQHVDNYTLIDHAKAHCESNELFKGIYAGKSRGVFGGTIIVRPDSQKTNAVQSNKSILLSDDASVETRPQLKIWADDVKCTHGATIGQLDEEALFYLKSRGISEDKSKQILVDAFATDVIDELENDELKDYLKKIFRDKLAQMLG